MKTQVEFIAMHRIVNALDRKTANMVRPYGLTLPQFSVMEALYHRGNLSVGELKVIVLSSDGTLPVVTRHLAEMGFLRTEKDEKDRRRTLLSLTEEGRSLMGKIYPENEKMLEDFFSQWTDEERDTARRLLLKLDRE